MVKKTKKSTLLSQWLIRKCTLLSHSWKGHFGECGSVRYIVSKHPIPSSSPKLTPSLHYYLEMVSHLCIPYCPPPTPPPTPPNIIHSLQEHFGMLFFSFLFCMHVQQLIASLYVWSFLIWYSPSPSPPPWLFLMWYSPSPPPPFILDEICTIFDLLHDNVYSVCMCSIQVYAHAVYRCMYMKYTGVCTWSIQVHAVDRCVYMKYAGVCTCCIQVYMQYTGVCTWYIQVYVHVLHGCVYMKYAGVCTCCMQVYGHEVYRCICLYMHYMYVHWVYRCNGTHSMHCSSVEMITKYFMIRIGLWGALTLAASKGRAVEAVFWLVQVSTACTSEGLCKGCSVICVQKRKRKHSVSMQFWNFDEITRCGGFKKKSSLHACLWRLKSNKVSFA